MKTATEMFKELKYKIFENNDIRLIYVHDDEDPYSCKEIGFNKRELTFGSSDDITYEELLAIIKQLEEIKGNK